MLKSSESPGYLLTILHSYQTYKPLANAEGSAQEWRNFRSRRDGEFPFCGRFRAWTRAAFRACLEIPKAGSHSDFRRAKKTPGFLGLFRSSVVSNGSRWGRGTGVNGCQTQNDFAQSFRL